MAIRPPLRVIITGMYAPYPGPLDGAEVWGCNNTYRHQDHLARLYFMDDVHHLEGVDPDFVERVNALSIPIVTRQHYPEIPKSEAFPLDEIMEHFFATTNRSFAYFTSTIAYMMADAIYKGAEEITIHRILVLPPANDYISQKGCLEFWCGIAIGRGIRLRISADSNLCKPLPWQPGLYGYETEILGPAHQTVVHAMQTAMRLEGGT